MCLIQDVINRKNRRAQTETQLSMHGIKSTNSYLQRLTWSSHSVANSRFFCGHGSRSISANNQLPATCVNLAQSDYDVSAIIKIERNKLRERFVHLWLKMKSHIQADFIAK